MEIEKKLENEQEEIFKTSEEQNGDNQNNGESSQEDMFANYKEMSPIRLVMRRFFRSKLSIVGIVIIVFLFLFSFLGPVIYRAWGETEVDRTQILAFTERLVTFVTPDGKEVTIKEVVPYYKSINSFASPSWTHLLGTDDKGMDVFARLMYGGRISLAIGFIVVILEIVLGTIIGGISGYFGKWVDQIIMRIVDVFNCLPTMPILLIASSILDANGVPGSL